jgi:uncharacterized membrane protein
MNVKYKILGRWISILAMFFVSLMPLISQAFEKDQLNNYQVICSSNGLKLIELNEDSLTNNAAKLNVNHCSYCASIIDDKILLAKVDKLQTSFVFFNSNIATSFLIPNKQNILENNHSQAPPSI